MSECVPRPPERAVIDIDGTQGEGGGQVLRTALTLSILTLQPFHTVGVRSRRPRPGILAQHLAAIRAAARLCGAQVVGAEIDSQELSFRSGIVAAGVVTLRVERGGHLEVHDVADRGGATRRGLGSACPAQIRAAGAGTCQTRKPASAARHAGVSRTGRTRTSSRT